MSGAGPGSVDTSHVRTPARTPAPWPRGASSPRPDPGPGPPAPGPSSAGSGRTGPSPTWQGSPRPEGRAQGRLASLAASGAGGLALVPPPQVPPEKDPCPMLTAPKPGAARSERQGAQGPPTLRFSASERSPALPARRLPGILWGAVRGTRPGPHSGQKACPEEGAFGVRVGLGSQGPPPVPPPAGPGPEAACSGDDLAFPGTLRSAGSKQRGCPGGLMKLLDPRPRGFSAQA